MAVDNKGLLLPEQRDVDAAYRMATADHADLVRAKREYGRSSVEADAAFEAYTASWAHYTATKELFGRRLEAEAEGATA